MTGEAKRVRVTLELSQSFVRLLNANIDLNGGILPSLPLDPAQVLARAVLGEARGAYSSQVDLIIPPEWRPDIDVVHEERRVAEDGKTWRASA